MFMFVDNNGIYCFVNDDIINGTFIVPDDVTVIPSMTFAYKENLEYMELPDSVIEIGQSAFLSCCNLKHIKLPKNLLKIERSTFDGCHSLEEIVFPENLQKIGKYAFQYCHSLGEIVLPSSTIVEKEAFNSCDNLTLVINSHNNTYSKINVSYNKVEINDEIYGENNDEFKKFSLIMPIKYISDNVFGNSDKLEISINTAFVLESEVSVLMTNVKSVCINGTIINIQKYDLLCNQLRKLRESELKEKIEFELIKNNLFDKKYLNDPEHKKVIKIIVDNYSKSVLYDYKVKLNNYIKYYIEKNKNNLIQLSVLNNNSMDEVLEKLNNYNVLPLQINNFRDISNYGNDLLEYSCYITDVYHKIVSRNENDVFTFKIEQLLGKINKRNISLLANKIDNESIKYLKLFSKYKINQDIEEIEMLQLLKEIIKIYITKGNEYLNNLLNYNHSYNDLNILLASDNSTIDQVMNDKINSLKNNMAVMIEYYKRVGLMMESNCIYISRLEIIQKQLNSIHLLENKKVEIKQINESITALNEVIITDKEKSKNVELTDDVINNLDEEIRTIIGEEKVLKK